MWCPLSSYFWLKVIKLGFFRLKLTHTHYSILLHSQVATQLFWFRGVSQSSTIHSLPPPYFQIITNPNKIFGPCSGLLSVLVIFLFIPPLFLAWNLWNFSLFHTTGPLSECNFTFMYVLLYACKSFGVFLIWVFTRVLVIEIYLLWMFFSEFLFGLTYITGGVEITCAMSTENITSRIFY